KSWEREVAPIFTAKVPPVRRRTELLWLAGATFLVASGLALVGMARVGQISADARVGSGPDDARVVNLNTVSSADDLEPFLGKTVSAAVFEYLKTHRPLPNVGALATVKVDGQRLPLRRLKPLMIVRTRDQFLREYGKWCAICLAAFWLVHFLY